MSVNSHLQPQLDAFARLANPGFALLVDAPWGAGKTHVLKGWMSGRKDTLYVSVYGAKNLDMIEEALFQALLEGKDVKPPQGFTQMVEGVAEKFTGAKVDLTGVYRRHILKDLPQIIIFDDLERSAMSFIELFSAINRFVEHERRNVVLLANQNELRVKDGDFFDRTKEKVIGRTISMKPATGAATESFLASIAGDESQLEAHAFLSTEKDLVCGVFESSRSSNLRLLRYATLEFARVFSQIPTDLRENTDAMRHLLATFVALSIAFHGGDGFGFDGLGQETGWARAVWDVNGRKGDPPAKSALELLQERFGEHPYVRLHGQVISAELAVAWIGEGHVADDVLDSELRKSSAFRTQDPEAWQTLWWWAKRTEDDVAASLAIVKKQLAENEFLDPRVIMHLAGIMLTFGERGMGWASRKAAAQEISSYISRLENEDLLPEHFHRRLWRDVSFDTGAFGLSFQQNESTEFHDIRGALGDALDRAFWRANPQRMKELLSLAATDPERFVEMIDDRGRRDGLPNYAHIPVFVDAEPEEAASLFFSLEPEASHEVLGPFERRVWRLEQEPGVRETVEQSERAWLQSVRKAAEDLASESTPIRAEQIRMAMKWHFGFLDRPDEEVEGGEGD